MGLLCSAFVASAGAALISTGACDNSTLTKPFLPWGDTNLYKLVPGGDFEGSLSGWTLAGGAKKATGSEPYGASGALGSYSLYLPAGASARTPFTCANASYPTFRFFARNNGLTSALVVNVLYRTPLGVGSLPLGVVTLSGSWRPTAPMLTGSLVGALLSEGTAQVALSFSAATASSNIDDIYIDPRMN
jgi:hypothetical protein